jgi:hypothetical protein
MSTSIVNPEAPAIDLKAHIAERNEAAHNASTPKTVQAKAEPVAEESKPEAPKDQHEESTPNSRRSMQRQINRYRDEAAELRGELRAIRETLSRNGAAPDAKPESADAEPKRENFRTDAEYSAAVGKWAAKAESQRLTTENEQMAALRDQIDRARDSLSDQSQYIKDWDKVLKDAEELTGLKDNVQLQLLMTTSDVGAFLVEYFVENPNKWEDFCKEKDEIELRRKFARLEGRMETVYNERQKAAQASKKEPKEPSKEERSHPAEEKSGRSATGNGNQDARLPRPTSEVAARGGTAAPPDPKPGTAAWMAMRNAKTQSSRY